MRIATAANLLLVSLFLLLTGAPATIAQQDDGGVRQFIQQNRPGLNPFQRRSILPPPGQRVPSPRYETSGPRRLAPSTVVVRDTPEKPKIDPTIFIAVFGDTLGELLGQGLEEAFAETPEVAVLRKAKGDSGLVRADFHDWNKVIRELLAQPETKITFAVMMIGANDRQSIREENGTSHEPGSERWRELYRARVAGIATAFAEKRIPLFWIGLPPMQSPSFSGHMLLLNELVRSEAQKNGATYIDTWEAFVDAQGRFTPFGPDITGQTLRLRTADGLHFTKPGARKAAHFAEVELKRQFDASAPTHVIAMPADSMAASSMPMELRPGGIEGAIDRMVRGLPEPSGVPVIPVKPLAGPIMLLTRVETSAGGLLASRRDPAPVNNEAQRLIEQVYAQGALPEPKPGRIDDWDWSRRR